MDTKRNWDEWLKQNIHLCTGIWIHLIHSSFTYCHFVENLCNGSDHHIIIPTYLPHIFCLHAYKIKKMVSFFFFERTSLFLGSRKSMFVNISPHSILFQNTSYVCFSFPKSKFILSKSNFENLSKVQT